MLRGYRFLIAAAYGLTVLIALGTGAYFGSLYAPDHKQYQTVTGNQTRSKDYQGPSQSLPDIAGLPGPAERAIANPRPTTGQDHEKRDLAAQEASAMWAFWMVLASFLSVFVTGVGTIFLYKQIILTREAVEDTGRATVAMERQNELAAIAQRPWVTIDAKITKILVKENVFSIWIQTNVKNIGNTVAQGVSMYTGVYQGEEKFDARAISKVRKKVTENPSPSPLIPGETTNYWNHVGYAISHMNVEDHGEERFTIILFVSARYFVPGDPEPKWTERAFSVCQGESADPFEPHGIKYPPSKTLKLGDLHFLPAGKTRVT